MKSGTAQQTDFLVIGCGIAGLRAAIELAGTGAHVLVLSKADLTESATQYAQGGIAAALSDEDKIHLHQQDTISAGAGLCNPAAVQVMVEEGPRYIQELIEWGTRFDREGTRLAFTREGAHSRSRVLHAQGDSTGREIVRALFARAHAFKTIEFLPFAFTAELLLDAQRVVGVRYIDEHHQRFGEIRAEAVLLATGGLGQVYAETTNPALATGDGVAVACRAGAELSDMEFVQFHPTALYLNGAPRFLLSEALRGEGGCLRNIDLEHFMPRYHEAGDLAPRDVVCHAIVTELERTGSEFVYLDMTGLNPEKVKARFPRIYATCLEHNLDITADLISVRPAAHYAMGGVATDLDGRTTLDGLFAAGEAACTGVHGANRLASNSLLEGLVFGAHAGHAMAAAAPRRKTKPARRARAAATAPANRRKSATSKVPPEVATCIDQIRRIMWEKVGIIRSGPALSEALDELAHWERPLPDLPSRPHYEAANLRLVGELIARSALAREESRGAHYRSDFPYRLEKEECQHSCIPHGQPVGFR